MKKNILRFNVLEGADVDFIFMGAGHKYYKLN
jgi:hypothetical protein